MFHFVELRFKKEYIQLLGIWFDSEKPDMNSFLTPLTQMFINSWHIGIIFLSIFKCLGIDVITPENKSLHTTLVEIFYNFTHVLHM